MYWVWVCGYGDGIDNSYGNLIVDDYVIIGKVYFIKGKVQFFLQMLVVEGYWKSEVVKYFFLVYCSFYFFINKDIQIFGEYYIGNQSKEDELLGKCIFDGVYGVIQLVEFEFIFEYVCGY